MIDFKPLIRALKKAGISPDAGPGRRQLFADLSGLLDQVKEGLEEEGDAASALNSCQLLKAVGTGMEVGTSKTWRVNDDFVDIFKEINRLAQEIHEAVYLPKHAAEHGHVTA